MPLPLRLSAIALLLLAVAAADAATELRGEGMTFVGSSTSEGEVVLRSRIATFHPAAGIAELEDVEGEVRGIGDGISFTMECDEAELDVASNDFVARGDVHGVTEGGQRYRAPWVEYDHEQGILSTDAPVEMKDDSGSFRGDGFRYYVQEQRFRLLGNVSLVQE